MAKTLFDHLKAVTESQSPTYWSTLDDADKKTWSTYMILRFLSMDNDWVDLVSDLQRYVQELPPESAYRMLIGCFPKGRKFLKYRKAKSSGKYEKWLIDLVANHYSESQLHSEEYLNILYGTSEGRQHVRDLCKMYAIEPAEIKKLKLKK